MVVGMGVTELEEARAALVAISPAGETPTLRLSSGEVRQQGVWYGQPLDGSWMAVDLHVPLHVATAC